MEKYLPQIVGEALVEWHDSVGVRLHICDIWSACVLPGGLPGKDKVGVIASEYGSEDNEQEEEDDKDHEYCLNVISLTSLYIICSIRIVDRGLSMSSVGDFECHNLREGLEEEEKPELSMVEFSYTAANPETVMVKLSDALITVPAVSAAERLHDLADLAEALFGNIDFLD